MEITDPEKTISLKITHFPQNLLIPSNDNNIIFEAINRTNKQAFFKFAFEVENLKIEIPDELKKDAIQFGPGETKNFEIKLIPTIDGFGKLSMFANWMKIVEYTVKVKKVRNVVPKSQINEILERQPILKVSKFADGFNIDDFIISITMDELTQIEKELEKKKKEYHSFHLLKQNILTQTEKSETEMSIEEIESNKKRLLEEIDNCSKKLAKGYLYNKNLEKSLNSALKLSNEQEKASFYHYLIRAYASINLDGSIEVIKNITNNDKKLSLIMNLAFDLVKRDPEQAPKVAYLIKDPLKRENLIIDIVNNTINLNPSVAAKICTLISDGLLKVKILYTIVKELHKRNSQTEISKVLNQIINVIEKSSKLNLSENNFNNSAYNFYKDAICALAEIDSPQAADTIIIGFNLREIKDKVAKDLFDTIYEMVDEIRTRMEPSPVYSHYYLFNTFISKINEFVNSFSLTGGNISNNILMNDFNFNAIIVSLFSYDFSIFPILDRVYSDLKFNLNKSFAYYIYPSKENHSQSELMTINNTLTQFLASSLKNAPNPILIFNLDLIPYLGKPTIILSSESGIDDEINSKIIENLGDSANLIIDESLFKDGATVDNLKQLFPPNMCKIVNLILSYEFINEYNILKSFIQSLI
ncbi:MAG: hypothetical protein ACFE8A_04775 [Candidatus Hodarchaeota archaeon]